MVTTLDHGQRAARKTYHCGLCNAVINPGDRHAFQTNVYDGRVYTWRDCLACDRDAVIHYVADWAGYDDSGVDYEQASEWAEEAVGWPKHWLRHNRPITTTERLAARNWLARASRDE